MNATQSFATQHKTSGMLEQQQQHNNISHLMSTALLVASCYELPVSKKAKIRLLQTD